MKLFIILLGYLMPVLIQANSDIDYRMQRNMILEREFNYSIGGEIVLDDEENLANEMLMKWKYEEFDEGFHNPDKFNFSRSYFDYKDNIQKSKVYEFLSKMPKGAGLHLHSSAMLGPDYYFSVTYKEYLYACFGEKLRFKFSFTTPNKTCDTQWKLMKDVRESVDDVAKFDMELRKNFTLVGADHSDKNSAWTRFLDIFDVIYPLWSFRPVWEEYFYEVLQQYRRDGIMYIEVRSSFPVLYELDGTKYDEIFFINTTKSVVDRFVQEYPDFVGVKIICSFNRHMQPMRIEELLRMTKNVKRIFPDFIAGFDLVGHEDIGAPLLQFVPMLQAAARDNDLNYFFHAGETNWYGTSPDENLIDAVLLGTKRIGHALALEKHPYILQKIKEEKIGLEVNVVSNNVLAYVHDMRNHPLALFIAQGLPVVLSSDDPAFWESAPLSTDFYVAFMGIASRSHDLRLLKQLALNSIEYSALNSQEKNATYQLFDSQWKIFITEFLSYTNSSNNIDNNIINIDNNSEEQQPQLSISVNNSEHDELVGQTQDEKTATPSAAAAAARRRRFSPTLLSSTMNKIFQKGAL